MVITYRKITPSEYSYCEKISKESIMPYLKNKPWNHEGFMKAISEGFGEVIFQSGEPVGFYNCQVKKDHVFIWDLHLLPRYTGKGIGQKTLDRIERVVKKKGYFTLRLNVFDSNPAVTFYQRNGFKKLTRKKNKFFMIKNMIS